MSGDDLKALGIVESFSGVSILAAADAAAKAAAVTLFRIHVAMALGGKGFLLLTGEQPDVESAVAAAVEEVGKRGLLVSQVVIPRPDRSLINEYI
jgi:microcompartment protein CcmL/EutN